MYGKKSLMLLPFSNRKKLVYKSLKICPDDSKMEIRKWNYPNRKWNNFSLFQSSDEKTYFTKFSPFGPMLPNWFSETGKGII